MSDKTKENGRVSDKMNSLARPKYRSATYYDVIVQSGTFMGWRATYVGLGRMAFTHPEHKQFDVYKGSSEAWMEECWNDFLDHALQVRSNDSDQWRRRAKGEIK